MAEPFKTWPRGTLVAWRGVACKVVFQLPWRHPDGHVHLLIAEDGNETWHVVSSRHVHEPPAGSEW